MLWSFVKLLEMCCMGNIVVGLNPFQGLSWRTLKLCHSTSITRTRHLWQNLSLPTLFFQCKGPAVGLDNNWNSHLAAWVMNVWHSIFNNVCFSDISQPGGLLCEDPSEWANWTLADGKWESYPSLGWIDLTDHRRVVWKPCISILDDLDAAGTWNLKSCFNKNLER